jgi:dipeptidyl aminopeptidase/acylaminoacyl peptidase
VLPSDIVQLIVPSVPTVAGRPGGGGLVLTALSRPDLDEDRNRSVIVRIGEDGPERWTSGGDDSAPVISPDGTHVAFLRPVPTNGTPRPQIHVMPTDGGEAKQVTALPLGADVPVWSPDSSRLAAVARFPAPGRYGSIDAAGRTPSSEAEAPRHITRLDYRMDGVGFTLDQRRQLVVVTVAEALREDGSAVDSPVTSTQCSLGAPVWTPDGTSVLVTAPRDLGQRETLASDLYRVDLTSGALELVARSANRIEVATFGPDGTLFWLGSSAEDGIVAEPGGLWAAHLSEEGPVEGRRLTSRTDVDVATERGTIVARAHDVLVAVLNRGAVEIRSVPSTGNAETRPLGLEELPVVLGGDVVVRGFIDVDGDVVASVADPTSAGEIVVVHAPSAAAAGTSGETATKLTDFGSALRASGLRPVEELHGTAPDGTPVHGWLVLPDGEGPHPVLRVVHGGPFAQQDRAVFDEAQVYASAGYAVVIGNPRGSAGYGLEHGRAVIGAMGTVDVDDVLALLDAALERDDLDSKRVGIMGGSYGGFMTSWVAAHHGDRFAAAWSERAVNAWDSFAGSSDIGWYFAEAYVGSDPDEQRKRSPLTYADQVSIPFLVAHSEHDWRCPIEQGQRQFVALRRAGVDAELLVFPGEGHELSRSGRPSHRVQRFEHVLKWWAKHLPIA